jgi:hypothetical protein
LSIIDSSASGAERNESSPTAGAFGWNVIVAVAVFGSGHYG